MIAMTDSAYPISADARDEIIKRLRRIEGQARGIQRMVEEGRDCREIVHQLSAIRAAVGSLNGLVLECYAQECFDCERPEAETVKELIDIVLKSSR
jgi:CsoR family transcriptional regulator, copper-sensing transcriptional repressor